MTKFFIQLYGGKAATPSTSSVGYSVLDIGYSNSMRAKPRLRGFTLIELILVITILSILMGFLFASLRAVRRYSREVSTRTELANLEAAFRQFYDHYGYWPIPDSTPENDDPEILLNEEIVNALAGKPNIALNPDQIPFFEIFRIGASQKHPGQTLAFNAWGNTYGEPYRVKFDTNGDNTLDVEGVTLHRSVVVWTLHPERENVILGSWQQ